MSAEEREAKARRAFRPALPHPNPLEAGKPGLFLYLRQRKKHASEIRRFHSRLNFVGGDSQGTQNPSPCSLGSREGHQH